MLLQNVFKLMLRSIWEGLLSLYLPGHNLCYPTAGTSGPVSHNQYQFTIIVQT